MRGAGLRPASAGETACRTFLVSTLLRLLDLQRPCEIMELTSVLPRCTTVALCRGSSFEIKTVQERGMSLSPGKMKHLKALSNSAGVIAAAAMDQRGSLQKSIAKEKGVDSKQVTQEMMEEFKIAVTKVLTPHASAILLDPEFGLP